MDLEEARQEWDVTIKGEGGYCPCCSRWGKVYPINIHRTMARALHWLSTTSFRNHDGWVNVREVAPKWVLRGGVLTSLKHWGLVQLYPRDKKEAASGILRVTDKGLNFLFNGYSIPKTAYIYADNLVDYSTEFTDVQGALKSAFDYAEMMDHRADGDYSYSFWREE